MTLRDCPPGGSVLLRELTAGGADRQRLLEWGFVPGVRLRLVARSLAGGLVVALGDARVALDAGLARSLVVEQHRETRADRPGRAAGRRSRRRPAPCCPPAGDRMDDRDASIPRVVLVGNPNVGKSTIFNALTGARHHVGNWPGKTVQVASGRWTTEGGPVTLTDLPGTYSLHRARRMRNSYAMSSPADLAGRPDLVVAVVDAANLARNLFLLGQVLDTGVPVVVALSMLDVAADRGVRVDPRPSAGIWRFGGAGASAHRAAVGPVGGDGGPDTRGRAGRADQS